MPTTTAANPERDLPAAPGTALEKTILALLCVGFTLWSMAFIFGTSFIALDGKRYFCLFDDAMVSMRYAWNFAHGHGLVWNPGEYVQGYTNLLMVMAMSLALAFLDKTAAILVIQVAGAVMVLGMALLTMRIADHFVHREPPHIRTPVRLMSFFCPLAYYPLAYWSIMGMETGLLTLLILAGVACALQFAATRANRYVLGAAACLGLAYLTRNDSLIFAVLVWAYLAWTVCSARGARPHLPALLAGACIYGAVVLGQGIFLHATYGTHLPNTYTLKIHGIPLAARLANGIGFIVPFLASSALVLAMAALDVLFRFQKEKLLLLALVGSATAYQVYVGGDVWNYWRIMAPTMPLAFVLFILAATGASGKVSSLLAGPEKTAASPAPSGNLVRHALVAVLLIAGLLSVNARFLPEQFFQAPPYTTPNNAQNVDIAILLERLTTPEATIGVFWAGAIPFFTGRPAIDFLGKSDRHIARLPPDLSGSVSWYGMKSVPGHNKYDLEYSIQTLLPDYVQGLHWGRQNLLPWAGETYAFLTCDGQRIFLLKESPAVFWDKVDRYCRKDSRTNGES